METDGKERWKTEREKGRDGRWRQNKRGIEKEWKKREGPLNILFTLLSPSARHQDSVPGLDRPAR